MTRNFLILGNRILVQKETVQSESKFLLPEIVEEEDSQFYAKIVSIGSRNKYPELKVGQRVFCNKRGGVDVMHQGQKCRVISTLDVLAIL